MPKISVVMSVYREPEKWLREAIESILNQTFRDFEFIIVLDDPNNKKAEGIIREYMKKDDRIVFLKNEKNGGLAYSLNRGIEVAKGKYIARMDADDISLPERLEKQYNYLEKNKDVDLLFTWAYYIDEKGDIWHKYTPRKEKFKNIKRSIFEPITKHPTLMARSEVLKKNKYDERLKSGEDFDLWMRLIAKGYKFDVLEEFLLKYRFVVDESERTVSRYYKYSKYDTIAILKNMWHYLDVPKMYIRLGYHILSILIIKLSPKKITPKLLNLLLSLKDKITISCR